MSLAAGSRLSGYEILAPVGAGGMGEVYRATDAKLGRDVAVKLLPEAFAADPDRLARFEREARLLASLNHPGIAHLYGFETATLPDGSSAHFLAMELVEGEDLDARLRRGPLPVEEALEIARQVAEALEEAHEKGIVHRDLKPANVKATPDGRVKVLDFGLAKAYSEQSGVGSSPDLSQSPTLAHTGTAAGLILGTAAYMSPEQARGRSIDKRADVWAFGVLLYELLTGRKLFEGDTVSDVLAAVLRQEIEWEGLPPSTPAAVRLLLRRCLERDPKQRLRDIGEARVVLQDELSGKHAEPIPPAPRRDADEPRRRLRVVALAAAALAAGAAGGWLLHPRAAPRPSIDSRWALALPDGYSLSTADTPQLALSRDGRLQAAVVVGKSGVSQLLVRRSDEFEPRLVEGTEGADLPFFSPDGAWIGFFRDDVLLKVPAGGGPSVRLATVTTSHRGGTWSSDGYIYLADTFAAPLSRVSENGGDVKPVTRLDAARNERTHRWPEALPGGDAVLFTCDTQASTEYYDDARIEAVRPATGERRVLVEGASQARYAPGHLVFARGGALFAVGFDPRTLEVHGNPRQVAEGVATNVGSGAVQFALSDSGAAVWSPGGLSALYRIVWVDRSGVETPVDVPTAPYQELALSPDGTRLALVGGQGGISDLWVADLRRGAITRLTSGEFVRNPIWSPDGTRIVFVVATKGADDFRGRLDWRPADGSREAETLVPEGPLSAPSAFTPDGRALLYDRTENGAAGDIWALPLDGDRQPRTLVSDRYLKYGATLSPDGKWLAYVSNESGQGSVYVRPFPRGDGRWQISIPRGEEPTWGPGGRELFYRADSVLYRVAIDTTHGFTAGRPEPLLDRVASGSQVHSYSLSPDGSRILTARAARGSGAQRILYLDLGFARRLDEPGSAGR